MPFREANEKYVDWLAFYKAATAEDQVDDDAKPPTSPDAAKKELCASSKCDGAGPWVVSVGGGRTMAAHSS